MRSANAGGHNYGGMVEWFDIGPTLCELAGLDGGALPYRQFARSLCPILDDPGRAHRSEALCELHGEVMVQTERWKLALDSGGAPYLLFDLRHDPDERRNLLGAGGNAGNEEAETTEKGKEVVVRELKDRILARLLQSTSYLDAQRMPDMPRFAEKR
jgi:arylsulfatase A-like enzyme